MHPIMNAFKAIRDRLDVTQKELADALGLSQGNVSLYEVKDQTVPPHVAQRLIEFATARGFALTFDDLYGEQPPKLRKLRKAA